MPLSATTCRSPEWHTYVRTTRRRRRRRRHRLLPHATTRAKCTRLGAQGVRTHNRNKDAKSTTLPYRTVVVLLGGDGIASTSFTNKWGLPCGRLLVFWQTDTSARTFPMYLHFSGPLRETARNPGGMILEGSPRFVFAVAVAAAVAVAFVALPDSIGSQYGKLHARRGTRRGKLVFPFSTYFFPSSFELPPFCLWVSVSSFLCELCRDVKHVV